MSPSYHEMVDGDTLVRHQPGIRHEQVCARLHAAVRASLQSIMVASLLPPREPVAFGHGTRLCPDLTLVAKATGKPWLIAEVVEATDHQADTVVKKAHYEEVKLPRLWMVDIRYDNVEVYHAGAYGMALHQMMAGKEILTEALLPALRIQVADLFKT